MFDKNIQNGAVRNKVIIDKQKILQALDKAKSIPGYIRTNERNPDTDNLGYKGHAIIFKTKNGMYGEVQINTPEIIYAKETESRGRKMLLAEALLSNPRIITKEEYDTY